ncbi:MAG: hypothetical protein HeimC3_22460 [Candidatus Heimdallarchaeota archaeon LC_3]|nr:MAG: hypothetical protein HeimC3_22460 [Candidatus Heimdallarchaeota archaeon LC_3]
MMRLISGLNPILGLSSEICALQNLIHDVWMLSDFAYLFFRFFEENNSLPSVYRVKNVNKFTNSKFEKILYPK